MILRLLAACLLSLGLLSGCASYHLGAPGESGPATIHVAVVINDSVTPQARALLTEQLRRQFGQSAQWQLAAEDDASHVLQVRLNRARQRIAATRQDDTGRGVSFATRLMATATLTGPDGALEEFPSLEIDGVIFDRPGQPEGAYQVLPAMTQRLAEQVYRQVTFR